MGTSRSLSLAAFALALFVAGTAHGYTTTQTQSIVADGQDITFTFANLPLVATGNVVVQIDLYGDFNWTDEYAQIYLDGTLQTPNHQGSGTQCNTTVTLGDGRENYVATSTMINPDRQLLVRVDLSAAVSGSYCNAQNDRVIVTLTYTGVPDLQPVISNFPATGATTGHSATFTGTYSVFNWFENFNGSFTNRFYYCPTAAYSATACVLLGSQTATVSIPAYSFWNGSTPTLTMPPQSEVGTRYILIRVDATNTATETNEANNDRFDSITVTTLPDLSLTAATVPTTPGLLNPGSQFTGSYTIGNANNTSQVSTDFGVRYWYCPNANPTGCTLLTTQTITQDILSGGTYSYTSVNLTIPAGAQAGQRYLRAIVDATGVVNEGNEGNNERYDPIWIGSGAPDLTVNNVVAPFSGSVAGAGSTFTVRYQLVNTTQYSLSTDFWVRFFYCPMSGPVGCTSLGTQFITNNFGPAGTYTATSGTLTMPIDAMIGTRYIRVQVDYTGAVAESDETNNNAYQPITVTTKPDLTVVSVTLPLTGNTSGPGSQFTARYRIDNAANSSAFATDFDVQYFYCPTNNNPPGCTQIGTGTITNNFSSGEQYSYNTATLTIPATAQAGTRYIRAVVDTGSAIDESNENNNAVYTAITVTNSAADLYVKTFTATPTGQTVAYSVEVCNQGGATTADIVVGLYYNRATAPDCTATTADQTATIAGGLTNNTCAVRTFTQTAAPAGTTTAWAFADQACAVPESSEGNNTKSVGLTVLPPPDQGPPKVDKGPEPDVGPQKDQGPQPEAKAPDQLVIPDQPPPPPDTGAPDKAPPVEIGPQGDTMPTPDKTPPAGDQKTPTEGPVANELGVIPDTGGTTADKGPAKADTSKPATPSDSGCSCTVERAGASGAEPLFVLLVLGAVVIAVRRRRR
jgi:MYXO-CTERM domain-containing protein